MTDTMSPKIAAAIVQVCRKVRQLGADDRNKHGGYNFVSVDKFYAAIGPLMADAGLATLASVSHSEVVSSVSDDGKTRSHLHMSWNLHLLHEDGDMYGPIRRDVIVVAAGPQAYASAESFVNKYFVRSVFKIPTGDRDDLDQQPNDPLPATHPQTKPAQRANDAKTEAVLKFVGQVNEFLDTEPTPADLFRYEGENVARMRRVRDGEFDHLPEVVTLMRRINAVYATAADATPES